MHSSLGAVFLAGTILSWELMGVIGAGVTEKYPHFYFFTWCLHNGYLLAGVIWVLMSKIYFRKNIRSLLVELNDKNLHLVSAVGSLFSLLGAVTWYYSLPITILSANNAIYQTSPLFVFMLSVQFLGHKVTPIKVIGLGICATGVVLVSFFTKDEVDGSGHVQRSEVFGYFLVMLSAFILAVFEVFYDYFTHEPETYEHQLLMDKEQEDLTYNFDVDNNEDRYDGLEFDSEIISKAVHGTVNSRSNLIDKQYKLGMDTRKTNLVDISKLELILDGEDADSVASEDSRQMQIRKTIEAWKFLFLMGVYNAILLWPGVLLVSAVGLEVEFEMPSDWGTWFRIVAVGICEMIYNGCLFSGIAVASASFMAVGQILIIPVGYSAEFLLFGHNFRDHSAENYIGVVLIIVGFLLLQQVDLIPCIKRPKNLLPH